MASGLPSSSAVAAAPRSGEPLRPQELGCYGLGVVAYQFTYTGLTALALPLFNLELGLNPVRVGAALTVARLWDTLLNPFVGAWSDRTRTRWGRRRPWIIAGAIGMAIAYPLVWFAPHGASPDRLTLHLFVMTWVLFTVFGVFSVPYLALGLELSPDYHERTRVQAWRTAFNIIPTLATGWFYWICQRPEFGDPIAGARWLGLVVAGVILMTGLAPGFGLKERYYRVAAVVPPESLWHSLRETLRCRPFLIVMAIIVFLSLGSMTTEALGFYVLAYHVFGGDTAAAAKLAGIATTVTALSAFAAIPLVTHVERRFGKRRALALCLWAYLFVSAAKWWLASPAHPWTFVLIGVFAQFGTLGFWIIINSMKADICDWDELGSHRRREGAYGAVGSLMQKSAAALTLMLSGLLIQGVGFNAALGAAQTPGAVLGMRLAFSFGPTVFLIVCLGLLRFYSLDAARMTDIRRQLEARRGTV